MKFYTLNNVIGIQVDANGKAILLLRDNDAIVKIDLQNTQFKPMDETERKQLNQDSKNF